MTSLPRPNSATNIHESSGYAGGAAQIPQENTINDMSRSKILQVLPKALPKFNWRTQLMTGLIP